jgi:hypothetical protein
MRKLERLSFSHAHAQFAQQSDEIAQQGLTARAPSAKPFCHGAVTKHRVAHACAFERWGMRMAKKPKKLELRREVSNYS